jgi:hypothetical protein
VRVPKQAQHDHGDVAHVQILLRILVGADVAGAGLALPLASLDLSGWPLVNDDVRALCNGLLRQGNQLLLSELLLSGTKVTGTHAGEGADCCRGACSPALVTAHLAAAPAVVPAMLLLLQAVPPIAPSTHGSEIACPSTCSMAPASHKKPTTTSGTGTELRKELGM